MKVYIVTGGAYDTVCGTYSSLEKAIEYYNKNCSWAHDITVCTVDSDDPEILDED